MYRELALTRGLTRKQLVFGRGIACVVSFPIVDSYFV